MKSERFVIISVILISRLFNPKISKYGVNIWNDKVRLSNPEPLFTKTIKNLKSCPAVNVPGVLPT